MTTRDGTSTILLYPSGVFFDPMNPDPAKIHVKDVAHHLSVIPRFGGGTALPYSVAQHSVLVSQYISAEALDVNPSASESARHFRNGLALWGLLHEVAEAMSGFGDVLAPVKRLPQVAAVVKPIERGIEAAAAKAWGLPEDFASSEIVKRGDRFVLDWEDRDLRDDGLPPHLGYAEHDLPLPTGKIIAWPWQEARARFLERYEELTR